MMIQIQMLIIFQFIMNVKEQAIDIERSENLNEAEQQLFLNVRRTKSDDSFLGKLIVPKTEHEKRPLFLNINSLDDNVLTHNGFHVFKKIKKEKKRNMCDYRKNICGYITKKIIREFTGPNYVCLVKSYCEGEQCDYKACKSFYQSKIEHVTGPSHIPALLVAADKSQIPMKKVFRKFFEWFLKERYVRYLLIEGKMTDKKAYIEYKNTTLLYMLEEYRLEEQQKQIDIKIQQQQNNE